MTHWKKLTNPTYLGAYAFEPGEEKIATIKAIRGEEIQRDNGDGEMKAVLYFEEDEVKPLILNKTNMKAIEKAYDTPYLEEWEGCPVVLCVQKVSSFGGDIVDAVRIRPIRPPVCENCGKVIRGNNEKSSTEVASESMKKWRKKLCRECQAEVKEI